MSILRINVAGVSFCKENLKMVSSQSSHVFELIHEKDNSYDPNAIRVDANSLKIGYIPKFMNTYFLELGLSNLTVVLDSWTRSGKGVVGCILKISFSEKEVANMRKDREKEKEQQKKEEKRKKEEELTKSRRKIMI